MFEYDQKIVNFLLNENNDFRRLYEQHEMIKRQVQEANERRISVDQFSLENLKKKKLHLKDRMSQMIENYRHTEK